MEHATSRRLLEKGGMRHCGLRLGEVDGALVELVSYEALARPPTAAHSATPRSTLAAKPASP